MLKRIEKLSEVVPNEIVYTSEDSQLVVRKEIFINNTIFLSIQGSESHYCTPKRYIENIDDYKEVEVLFAFSLSKNKEIIKELVETYCIDFTELFIEIGRHVLTDYDVIKFVYANMNVNDVISLYNNLVDVINDIN